MAQVLTPPTPGTSAALSGALAGYNTSIQNYQDLANKQASDLNAFTGTQQGTISNAYQTAAGQTGLQGYQDSVNKIQGQLNGSQNASAAVVPQTIAAAAGSFANNDQVNTQEHTSNIPYAEQIAQLSANLVPAENAESTAATNTQNIAGNIVSGAQLAEQGFTQGQQNQLAALQAKVEQGAALTSSEYSTYATLSAASTQAAAQISSAKIAGAYANPGGSLTFDANGNPHVTVDTFGPGSTGSNNLQSQLAQQIVKNPSVMDPANKSATIARLMSQTPGLTEQQAMDALKSAVATYAPLLNYTAPNSEIPPPTPNSGPLRFETR